MNQANVTKTPTHSIYDGWVRLWEAIYGCPWPGKDRNASQWLAAYLDWKTAQ
ncbi:MAG TPA: hypothetical protein VK066_11930 [Chloroflexota bacterium]|nr:hypothetical protein [Chloroflexota bacterium]